MNVRNSTYVAISEHRQVPMRHVDETHSLRTYIEQRLEKLQQEESVQIVLCGSMGSLSAETGEKHDTMK